MEVVMSRCDIMDIEWGFIEPVLPNRVRGVARVGWPPCVEQDFLCLGSGCQWRDLPERYGPYTTVYNRFNLWTKAGVYVRIMDAIVNAHNCDVVMTDGTSVRVYHAQTNSWCTCG